jgi:hypothetical protein
LPTPPKNLAKLQPTSLNSLAEFEPLKELWTWSGSKAKRIRGHHGRQKRKDKSSVEVGRMEKGSGITSHATLAKEIDPYEHPRPVTATAQREVAADDAQISRQSRAKAAG